MMALFTDMQSASKAVAAIISAHVVPCTLEFLDHATINYVEDYVKIGLPRDAGAMLLVEVDGHPAQVEDDAAVVEKVLKECGSTEVSWPRTPSRRRTSGKPAAWPFRPLPAPNPPS